MPAMGSTIDDAKRARLDEILSDGVAMIHLDARRAGVAVPSALRSELHLSLNLSRRFDPPDLDVGDWGVRETLSFGGSSFACAVPWSAIFAISNKERIWAFPEDIPEELLEEFAKAVRAEQGSERAPLRVVTPADSPAAEAMGAAPGPVSEKRPKLRLVKND